MKIFSAGIRHHVKIFEDPYNDSIQISERDAQNVTFVVGCYI